MHTVAMPNFILVLKVSSQVELGLEPPGAAHRWSIAVFHLVVASYSAYTVLEADLMPILLILLQLSLIGETKALPIMDDFQGTSTPFISPSPWIHSSSNIFGMQTASFSPSAFQNDLFSPSNQPTTTAAQPPKDTANIVGEVAKK